MRNKPPKQHKCKECGGYYVKSQSTQQVCSMKCAIAFSKRKAEEKRKKLEKADRLEVNKRMRERKEALKNSDKRYWLNKVQEKVNKFIRLRDRGLPCIACGEGWKPNFQASHYVPRGRSSFLRYHEDNIHSGCVRCNLYESGNLRLFRIGLIKKIGIERVEWLEDNARHIKKWDIDELKEMVKEYEQKIKDLECQM